MTELLFVTHADVVIDPAVPVPEWGLNDRGRARHLAHARAMASVRVDALWSSPERKARDAADILGAALGLTAAILPGLAENDRSATGYLPGPAFEAAADAFFAEPDRSFRGWETAKAAQRRIVATVSEICGMAKPGDLVVAVAHGAVGALLMAHAEGAPISRVLDQPGRGGGQAFRLTWPDWRLRHGWRDLAPET